MKKHTWEELADSQEFEHGQEFVTIEECVSCIAIAKGQFDIVKMQRDRLIEAMKEIKLASIDSDITDIASEALKSCNALLEVKQKG